MNISAKLTLIFIGLTVPSITMARELRGSMLEEQDMLQSTNASLENTSSHDVLFLHADTYDHILEVDARNLNIDGVDAEAHQLDEILERVEHDGGEGPQRRLYSANRFYLRNKGTGKYLDVAGGHCHNGNNIQLWEFFNGSEAQQFYWHTDPSGNTYLINHGCTKAVDISQDHGGCGDGANIHLWTYHGGSNQQFNRYNDIIYNKGCNSAIDNSGRGSRNGNNIISYDINLTTAQQWAIEYL